MRWRSPDVETRPGGSGSGGFLLHVTQAAMACEFTIYLNAGQYLRAAERAIQALDLLEPLEEQLSVYRVHSEVSEINRRAAAQPVLLERNLCELLRRGLQLSEATKGAFDMTAGPLSRVWGFYRRQGRLPDTVELQAAQACVGCQHVRLNTASQTIAFAINGVELNLGGIGKGYALDRCSEYLLEDGIGNFLIQGGFSSVLARGSRLGRSGWQVDIRHPLRPQQRLAAVHLEDRCLGTSGSATQSFYHEGRRYGHILDPRTGWPADQLLSASVIAADAATADAMATALFVLGVQEAVEVCQQLPAISAILIARGRRAGEVQVHALRMSSLNWECFEPSIEEVS